MQFEREADRLEVLIIRPIYSFILSIVLAIYGLIAGICQAIQWLVVLIMGERNEGLNAPIKTYIEFYIQILPYISLLTDERPDLTHKQVNIFIERLENPNNKEEYIPFEREADRLEVLIIRPIFTLILFIVLAIYRIIAQICMLIQWLVVLIMGERNEGLNNPIKDYVEFSIQILPYISLLTDKRPDFSHKQMNVYVERLE